MIGVPSSRPGPATTFHRPGREAGLLQEVGAEQRRQHGLGVRLGHHGVAGEQRGKPVAQRHRERVVPRRDDADDALGHVVDLDPGQPGYDAELALGVEVVVRGPRVVAGGQRDVQRLVEGVLACLARLPADQVDDLVLAIEHQVVQAQQDLRTLLESRPRPRLLGAPRPRERVTDVRLARLRDHRQRLAGDRGVRRDRRPCRGEDPVGQRPRVRRVQGVRRRRVVLRIGRADLLAGVGRLGLRSHAGQPRLGGNFTQRGVL